MYQAYLDKVIFPPKIYKLYLKIIFLCVNYIQIFFTNIN